MSSLETEIMFEMKTMKRNVRGAYPQGGFTLVELLVVISINDVLREVP